MFNKHKLDEKFFNTIIVICQFVQLLLVVLSFLIIIYWIFDIANLVNNQYLINFFGGIKDFVHTFYKRTVLVSGKEIDFSYLVAVFLCLSIVWFIRLAIEVVEEIEDKYFNLKLSVEQKAENAFNKLLENELLHEEYKNNKVLLLLKVKAQKIKKIELFRDEVKAETECNEIESSALKDLFSVLGKFYHGHVKNLENCIVIYLNDFKNVDSLIQNVEKYEKGLINEYEKEGWQLEIIKGLEVYSATSEITEKVEKLKILLNIFTMTETACLSSFKQRYLLNNPPLYSFEPQGIYKIIDNEEVYTLRKMK